jgi:hypothetical protein
MISILISLLVVFCGIYCVLWVIALLLGFFVPAVKANSFYPLGGANYMGSWISFAIALTIYLVLGHHSLSSFH